MDKQYFFERNLLALDRDNDDLCERLSSAVTTRARYRMLESRDGKVIPSIVDSGGRAHPLHSLIDPVKEAERLVDSVCGAGFLVFLGLGGGYQVEAALKSKSLEQALIIDFDLDGIAELLANKDFVSVFNDKRVSLLVDPGNKEVEYKILAAYKPLLHGNMRSVPLRARCDAEKSKFIPVFNAINAAVEKISLDYSVQAQFGKRWFSNSVRNIILSEKHNTVFPPVAKAAVCAAGPSLDRQIAALKEKRGGLFVIATDTSCRTLLENGIRPDAVIAIDCQHISYHHFIGVARIDAAFFLDIAAPPRLAALSPFPCFFADSHPFARFAAKYYKAFPYIDTSGGNVTYAAVSLAAALQAKTIELYGADFSYPEGKTYTKGAYLYPYFDYRQNRLVTTETLFSSFLFRSSHLSKITKPGGWFYQTPPLALYKKSLVDYVSTLETVLIPVEGLGDALPPVIPSLSASRERRLFSTGSPKMKAEAFLRFYRDTVDSLPVPQGGIEAYSASLSVLQSEVFYSLLPLGASIQSSGDIHLLAGVLEEVKCYCGALIQKVLSRS